MSFKNSSQNSDILNQKENAYADLDTFNMVEQLNTSVEDKGLAVITADDTVVYKTLEHGDSSNEEKMRPASYEKLKEDGLHDETIYNEIHRKRIHNFLKNLNPGKKDLVVFVLLVSSIVLFLISVILFAIPKEKEIQCEKPSVIRNGVIQHMSGLKHGDTIAMKCTEGYQMVGRSVITCLSSGYWSALPSCKPGKCKAFAFPENTKLMDGNGQRSDNIGTSIILTCKAGYKVNGNDTVSCQENQQWSKPPVCTAIDCGYPPCVPHGTIQDFTGTKVNQSFSIQCEYGYILEGPEIVNCKSEGQWSETPVCKRVTCGEPDIPDHANITDMKGDAVLSAVLFRCDEGFIMRGSPLQVCQSNGSWTESPLCVKVVDGGFSLWRSWGKCTMTCGNGSQSRSRTCTNPVPQFGGAECVGERSQTRTCNLGICQVDGGFSLWTSWGKCTTTCGDGSQRRSRTCTNPVPQFGGAECVGERSQTRTCNLGICQGPCLAATNQNQCLSGEMCVDLNEKGTITGHLNGVAVQTSPTSLLGGHVCSRQALFKVTFEKLPSSSTGLCHKGTYSGRRMLKVQMFFSSAYRHLWMFNIGDSQSNDGWAGDHSNMQYEAEIQGYGKHIDAYSNDVHHLNCNAKSLYHYGDATNTSVQNVNVWIANNYIKVANDNGLCERNCNKCLYGLNGQIDYGSTNQDIYVAANRVVSGSHRNGYGLCFLKMSWVNTPEE